MNTPALFENLQEYTTVSFLQDTGLPLVLKESIPSEEDLIDRVANGEQPLSKNGVFLETCFFPRTVKWVSDILNLPFEQPLFPDEEMKKVITSSYLTEEAEKL